MTSPLIALLPFFALVLAGYSTARRGLLNGAGIKGLNTFVFYFALPALLFDKTQAAPIDKLVAERAYLLAYALATLCVFALGWVGAKLVFRAGPGRAAILGLGGAYSNIGFMGIPVLTAVVGEWAAVPLALMVLVDVALVVPVAIVIVDLTRPRDQRRDLKAALAGSVLKNPIVLATLAGLGVAALGWQLPGPVTIFTELLGRSAGPAAMFALGAVLAGRALSEGLGEALYASAFKLAVHPLAIWWAMTAFAIGADWRLAATLGGALPMATAIFVIAQQYDVMPQRASTAVLISTVLSMLTLTALTAWLAN